MKVSTAEKNLRNLKLVSEMDRQIIRNLFDNIATAAFEAGQSGKFTNYAHYIQPTPLDKPRKKYAD